MRVNNSLFDGSDCGCANQLHARAPVALHPAHAQRPPPLAICRPKARRARRRAQPDPPTPRERARPSVRRSATTAPAPPTSRARPSPTEASPSPHAHRHSCTRRARSRPCAGRTGATVRVRARGPCQARVQQYQESRVRVLCRFVRDPPRSVIKLLIVSASFAFNFV